MEQPPGIADDVLGVVAAAQVGVARWITRSVLGSPWLVRRLGRSRAEPRRGTTFDPQMAALLTLDDISHASDLRKLAPPKARRRVMESIGVCDGPRITTVDVVDRTLGEGPARSSVRLYEPTDLARPSPGIVFIHGGGWVTGSVTSHDRLCRRIASEARCRVVSVRYRLAPEHRFPAAVDDCLAAFRAIASAAPELGIDPTRLAVCGDSAGGNLSAVLSQRLRGDTVNPCLQVLLYPALDGTCRLPSHAELGDRYFLTSGMVDWYYKHYSADARRDDPDLSPLHHRELSGLPPALVYTCGYDPLVDEGKEYAGRLSAVGVPVTYRCFEALPHGFTLLTGASDAADTALRELLGEVRGALHAPSAP